MQNSADDQPDVTGDQPLATDSPLTGRQPLSADAIRIYAAITRQESVTDDDKPHLDELAVWGLIGFDNDRPGVPVPLNPKEALNRRLEDELAEARARVARLTELPALSEELGKYFERAQWRTLGGSEYLEDAPSVNARLDDVIAGARTEILAAQPGGPRTRALLERSVARDQQALTRGVTLRTLYRDPVRDNPVTAEYARIMTELGARYRTLVGPFERCIVVDRRIAFINDHVVEGGPEHAAWCVTDRATVRYIAAEFEGKWRRAEPWRGETHSRGGETDGPAAGCGVGFSTTRRHREIIRCLLSGRTTAAVAAQIGVSKRKLDDEIAEVKRRAGVSTLMELGFWWATCPDRLMDDPAPAADSGEPGPAGAAVA